MVAVASLGGLFLMALFFLISGLLTQDSLSRKGPSRFVSDRLWRLGLPFAIYTLLVWPLLEYALHEPLLHERSYWQSFLDTDPVLDNGPMWFVGVLLLYSLGLVVWRRLIPPPASPDGALQGRQLILISVAIGVSTFFVRIALPADSGQPLNSHVWAWPEYIAMFGLGVVAARRGWLRPVPEALARRCGIATVVAVVCTAAAILSAEPLGFTEDAFAGGWQLPALFAAVTEGVLAVSAPIWVLALARRHLNGTGHLRRRWHEAPTWRVHAAGAGARGACARAPTDGSPWRREGTPGRDTGHSRIVRPSVAARHANAASTDPLTNHRTWTPTRLAVIGSVRGVSVCYPVGELTRSSVGVSPRQEPLWSRGATP